MNQNAVVGWICIFLIVIILACLLFKNFGVFTIINIIFWLYLVFIVCVILYEYYLDYSNNPNAQNRVGIVFENVGSFFREQRRVGEAKEFEQSLDPITKDPSVLALYKSAYKLGFPLEKGEPNQKWVLEKMSQLEQNGEQKYYENLKENNKNRIKSFSTSDIPIHDTNTMTNSVYHYNSFDTIENIDDGHVYVYTREEWDWISKNKISPWTRQPIANIVLKTIQTRSRISRYLGDVFVYPIKDEVSQSEVSSEVSQVNSFKIEDLDQVEGMA